MVYLHFVLQIYLHLLTCLIASIVNISVLELGIGYKNTVGLSTFLFIAYCVGLPVCDLLGNTLYSSKDILVNCVSVAAILALTVIIKASFTESSKS